MASSWSRSLGIGNYGSQMKVTVQVLSQNKSANTSRVKVTIQAYNGGGSRAYNQGSGATVSVSGNGISHSAQVKFSISGRTWFTFADWQFTVSHNANGTLPVNIVGRIADTGTSSLGNGGGIRIEGTANPLYLAPTAPSWGSTAYQNASSVRLGWTNRASARGAYSNVRVQRWLRSTGTWTNRALLSGGSSSYTDTSIPTNDEVRWRVRAEGPGGNSGWSTGGTLGTVPAGASNVQATKSGQGVRVTWTDNAGPTNRTRTFYIDDNPGGTGWVRVGSIGGSATAWTHSDADPSVTHQYRIWTRITSGIDLTATGTGGPSNVVQLQAAPKQPGRVGPKDVVPLEVGDTLELEWTHNPVDTTEQTEAEVQWRLDGGSWTTSKVTGAANTFKVTPSTSLARVKFEWRVRTKGAHPDWSPWSTTNGPLLSTRPRVVLQSPESGEALTVSRVLATWAYEPGGDQSQLQQAEWSAVLSLYASGTPIENAAGTSETEVQLETRLSNRTQYALTLTVRNGDGLWSSTEVSVFNTDFPLPAEVEVFPEWDQDSGAVSVGFGESEALRATYRWAGEPNDSTSEAVNDGGLPNLVNPVVSTAQWVGSGGARVSSQPRGSGFPWLPDSVDQVARVDYAGSGSRYISLLRSARPQAVPGKWYGLAVSIQTPSGVKGDLRLQFASGGTRASVSESLPPEGGQLAVVGQAQEGDGTVWPVVWPELSEDPFYVTGAVLVEAESEEEAWEALRRGLNPDVAETNLIENPRFAKDGAYFSITGRAEHLDGGLVRLECRGSTPYLGQFVDVSPGQWFAFASEVAWDDNGIGRHRHQIQFRGPGGVSVSAPQLPVDQSDLPDGGRVVLVEKVPEGATEARCYVWGYQEGDWTPPEVGATHRTGLWHAATAWTEEDARRSVETYFDGDSTGTTDVDAVDVERRQPDGSWVLVASGVPTSTTVVDRTPHIGDVEYRAVSRTVLPTEQTGPSSTAVWVHDQDPVFVNGGEGMDQVCLARGNQATDEHEVDQALHRFAGQDRPTAFFGPGQDHTTSFTGKILPHYHLPTSTRQEWVQLLRQRGLVCFRDCTGRKVFGVLSVGFSQTGNVEQVELSVQEAVYTEGVARVSDLDLEQGETED